MWDSLDCMLNIADVSWVLCGNFNEVRELSERLNCEYIRARAKRFNDFITRKRLVEIPLGGRKFTRISDDGAKMSKLDRFLVSDSFLPLGPDLRVNALDRKFSDHCPIMLLDNEVDFGPKPFKVFDDWICIEGVDKVVEQSWKEELGGYRMDCVFCNKLKRLKNTLKVWSKSQFGGIDEEIDKAKKEAIEFELKAENIFAEDHCTRPSFDGLEYASIFTDIAESLELPFTEDEIWDAIKSCGSSKAPSPDEFNLGFYKKFWYIIKDDLVAAIMWFWEKGEFSRGCNAYFISLVPKKTEKCPVLID
ncbi:uncharacterized protein [Rutidosis leptorrhynchoides]|uniref:uncharacterized protein n=1 Tax=Rutidosis leptorrhynchoides TaxID=125765 RepID=UPI003A994E0A